MKNTLLLSSLVVATASTASAVNFSVNAAVNSGFALSDGTDLPVGSLVLFGAFSISDSQITANSGSLSFLNSNFIQIGSAVIGQGNPAEGAGPSDPVNAGLFYGDAFNVNTTASGLNVSGLKLYYWVFNSSSVGSATQHGIFSSTLSSWTIPSGDGGGLDLAVINTDIADLTVGQEGNELAGTAKILIGGFGSGINQAGGGRDFTLAAIPEPSAAVALAGAAILGFAATRRRLRTV